MKSRIETVRPVASASAMSLMPLSCRAASSPDVTMTFLPDARCFLILPTMPGSNLALSVSKTMSASLGNFGVSSIGMPMLPR